MIAAHCPACHKNFDAEERADRAAACPVCGAQFKLGPSPAELKKKLESDDPAEQVEGLAAAQRLTREPGLMSRIIGKMKARRAQTESPAPVAESDAEPTAESDAAPADAGASEPEPPELAEVIDGPTADPSQLVDIDPDALTEALEAIEQRLADHVGEAELERFKARAAEQFGVFLQSIEAVIREEFGDDICAVILDAAGADPDKRDELDDLPTG